MKNYYRITLMLVMMTFISVMFMTCSEDDSAGGEPRISYVRITDPNASDSLLVGATQGSVVAIMGENLGSVRQVWFNNRQASLSPSYVTNTTIITSVPNQIPTEINNLMTLVFKNGETLTHDFEVVVSSPEPTRMECEYVPTGEVAVIRGSYFYEPVTVTFTGDVEGEVVSVNENIIEVIVPEGAEKGPITVTSNFGSTESEFWFRDDRNLIVDFDTKLSRSWNSPSGIKEDIPPVSGNYNYFQANGVGAWTWQNALNMMYIAEDGTTGQGNIPIFPEDASVSTYGIRFEIFVAFDWSQIPLEIFFARFGQDHGRDVPMPLTRWRPWEGAEEGIYRPDGWVTVTIPLSEFDEDKDGNDLALTNSDLPTLTNVTIMFFGAANEPQNVNIAIDNVRVVKIQ